jgi:hypothetical protein
MFNEYAVMTIPVHTTENTAPVTTWEAFTSIYI